MWGIKGSIRIAGLAGAGVLLACLAAGVLLWAFQSRLIFEPERALHAAPGDFPFPVAEVGIPIGAAAPHRQTVSGWWIPSGHSGAKVVLYLHGNDGNVTTSMSEIEPLRQLGYSVLVIDYRGYGKSAARFPSESSVYEDAEAAWAYLVREQGVSPAQLYIYGHSLGGAIAIELATRHPEAAGLIVESSFTSIYEMAMLERRYALLPIQPFLNQRFDSIRKVSGLRLPVLYMHGTADEIVPFSMGRRLFSESSGMKSFVAIEGGRHGDNSVAGGPAFRAAIRGFVDQPG
jgi:pimeloyl-ACP methyl ester carboxylesterase